MTVTTPLVEDLRLKRRLAFSAAQRLAGRAEEHCRTFTDQEQREFDGLQAELDMYDDRIGVLVGEEQRGQDATAAFDRLQGPATGRNRPLSDVDADLDHAFRSAIRSKNPAPI